MILSLKQLSLLVPDGTLDEKFYKQFVELAKGSSVLDVAKVPEAFRRDLVELFEANPQIVATAEEVEAAQAEAARQQNVLDVAARIRWWLFQNVDKDGRRLAKIIFNRDRIIQALDKQREKQGKDPNPADVDATVAKLSHELQWEIIQSAPAPAPAAPPPPIRTLPSGEPELPLDASESQMRAASVEQLRDLDARRRGGRKFIAVTHGSGSQLMVSEDMLPPLPPEISPKAIKNAPSNLLKNWRNRFGQQALDDRLAGRG